MEEGQRRIRVDSREEKGTNENREPFKTMEATKFTCKGAGSLIRSQSSAGFLQWEKRADKGLISSFEELVSHPKKTNLIGYASHANLATLAAEPPQYVRRKIPSALRLLIPLQL